MTTQNLATQKISNGRRASGNLIFQSRDFYTLDSAVPKIPDKAPSHNSGMTGRKWRCVGKRDQGEFLGN